MSSHGFTSAFATELDAYLAFKASMGFCGSRIWYLKKFDAYCSERDRAVFDKDTVEGWVSVQLERSGRYRSWLSYIRDFGRWLKANGGTTLTRWAHDFSVVGLADNARPTGRSIEPSVTGAEGPIGPTSRGRSR